MMKNHRIRIVVSIGALLGFALFQVAYGLEGKLASDMAAQLENSCKNDVPKVNPLADKKKTAAYCKCFGQDTAAGMNDEDVGALLSDKETAHMSQLLDETTALCGRRHFNTQSKQNYDDLPDITVRDIIRAKAGVFTAGPVSGTTVVMDSEQIYMVQIKDYYCWWAVEPSMSQSPREVIAKIKEDWPTQVKSIMRSPDARISRLDETRVRNQPSVFMEITSKREGIDGKSQDMMTLAAIMIDADNSAIVSGFCSVGAGNFEKNKSSMRRLTTAAMSARKYRD
jgi:hypothetical protein